MDIHGEKRTQIARIARRAAFSAVGILQELSGIDREICRRPTDQREVMIRKYNSSE